MAPGIRISELDAHERGPAEAVQARWNLERGMSNGGPDGFEELLEAAYAEPKLRQLYPLSSHWTCISVGTPATRRTVHRHHPRRPIPNQRHSPTDLSQTKPRRKLDGKATDSTGTYTSNPL